MRKENSMNIIRLSSSIKKERQELNNIFEEARPYFNQVEGRDPLPPLIDIQTIIPSIPKELTKCLSIYYLDQLIGYLWVWEESKTNIYILHLYIREKHRKLGLGKLAIQTLDKQYLDKGFLTSELLVSGSNYLGLKFWLSVGFNKLLYVEAPEENGPTSSVEIELQKDLYWKNKSNVLERKHDQLDQTL